MVIDLSKPVRTRSGNKVKIWRTDARGRYPVFGSIETQDGTIEAVASWTRAGEFTYNGEDSRDLVPDTYTEKCEAVDFTKPLQTRNGKSVEILKMDANHPLYPVVGVINLEEGDFPSCWTKEGYYNERAHGVDYDLVNTNVHECWVNVYGFSLGSPNRTKSAADTAATNARTACLRLEWGDGDGL